MLYEVITLALIPPLKDSDREAMMKLLYQKRFDNFYGPIKFGPDGANGIHPSYNFV